MKGDELGRAAELQAAQALQPGAVSDIIQTGNGRALMRCLEKKTDRYADFSRAHGLIIQRWIDGHYAAIVDSMVNAAKVRIIRKMYARVYP